MPESYFRARPLGLPELTLLCRRPHHRVAWFALESTLEFWQIPECRNSPPLRDRVRVCIYLQPHCLLAHFHSPQTRKRDEKPLICAEESSPGCRRALVSREYCPPRQLPIRGRSIEPFEI